MDVTFLVMMFVSVCLLQPVVCGSFLPQGFLVNTELVNTESIEIGENQKKICQCSGL